MKEYRCLEGLVVGGPGGRIVAVGKTETAERWAQEVGLDILQWTDFAEPEAAAQRGLDFIASPYVRFQPIDRERTTLDVFWMGPDSGELDKDDPVVKKILGPHFAVQD